VAFGENSVREAWNGCCYGLHAEMDALRKLPFIPKKNRKIEINLLVIRVDKHGLIKNSEPCFMCIKHMDRLTKTTAYKLNDIYYSDENGNVILRKFDEMRLDPEKHISLRFRKNIKINKTSK
jgi:hypothetical protein